MTFSLRQPGLAGKVTRQDLEIAQRIADRLQMNLELQHVLRGGMGVVYVVRDLDSPVAYAVKTFRDEVIARSPAVAQRFGHEALAWVRLGKHPNVVRARLVVTIHDKPFVCLEYVPGGDLKQKITGGSIRGNLPAVLDLAIQFCDGMIHAASNGIKVHRDVKPQNCLLTRYDVIKVSDFGLAKVLDEVGLEARIAPPMRTPASLEGYDCFGEHLFHGPAALPAEGAAETVDFEPRLSLTGTGQGMGTPPYMAPEQFGDAKNVDVRADVYSFGVMLFEMITGRIPFRGRSMSDYQLLHTTQEPPDLRDNPALNEVLRTCLAKDPAQRPADFGIVREHLDVLHKRITGTSVERQVNWLDFDKEDWLDMGFSLAELGRHDEAIACYQRALARMPGHEGIIKLYMGTSLAKLERHEDALVCLDRASALRPNHVETWRGKGASYFQLSRPREARACFERAIAIQPECYEAWEALGVILRAQGDNAAAVRCFDKAIELAVAEGMRQNEYCWVNKAAALAALGKQQEALICCEHALEQIPDSALLWVKKAQLLGLTTDFAEAAIDCYDRAIAINPKNVEAWVGKGVLLARLLKHLDPISGPPPDGVVKDRKEQLLVCIAHAQKLGHCDATILRYCADAAEG